MRTERERTDRIAAAFSDGSALKKNMHRCTGKSGVRHKSALRVDDCLCEVSDVFITMEISYECWREV